MGPQPSNGVVLIVEDPFVCKFVSTVLARRGYDCVEARLERGIERLRSGEPRAALVITNTPEPFLPFAQSIPLLYMAAFPDEDLAARFSRCLTLPKPFLNEILVAAVEELASSPVAPL
jgi:hypothetical protein